MNFWLLNIEMVGSEKITSWEPHLFSFKAYNIVLKILFLLIYLFILICVNPHYLHSTAALSSLVILLKKQHI